MNESASSLAFPSTDRTQHVTAVITHRVKSGQEGSYEKWIKGISAAARAFDGHLGVNILRPQPSSPSDYTIVLRFDTCGHLTAWLNSKTRKAWIEKVKPFIREQETMQILTGLESWFQLPSQTGSSAPKRYKQALLIWLGVMSVSLFVSPWIAPLLAPLPWLLRVSINVAVTVTVLSYVIMPWLTRRFRHWLFAD